MLKPFNPHEGFCSHWWVGQADEGSEFLQFRVDGRVVARAEVKQDNASSFPEMEGLKTPPVLQEVVFIEVDRGYRSKGFGTDFIARLEEHYADFTLAAYSEEADDFWRSVGWHHCPHRDGQDSCRRNFFTSAEL
ncbi:hypothetical protein MHJ95_07225 [Corynebacterium imitans]|nr:GNAT family N-acetyltransferase [Corynebacterium imitans]MCG7278774.1 hypothetical protein [Corynebacterium imitans]